jgi:hypothetical protein
MYKTPFLIWKWSLVISINKSWIDRMGAAHRQWRGSFEILFSKTKILIYFMIFYRDNWLSFSLFLTPTNTFQSERLAPKNVERKTIYVTWQVRTRIAPSSV